MDPTHVDEPEKRRFQFSLYSLFMTITVTCVLLNAGAIALLAILGAVVIPVLYATFIIGVFALLQGPLMYFAHKHISRDNDEQAP